MSAFLIGLNFNCKSYNENQSFTSVPKTMYSAWIENYSNVVTKSLYYESPC